MLNPLRVGGKADVDAVASRGVVVGLIAALKGGEAGDSTNGSISSNCPTSQLSIDLAFPSLPIGLLA